LDVPVHALDDHNIDPTLYVTLGITSNQVSVSSTEPTCAISDGTLYGLSAISVSDAVAPTLGGTDYAYVTVSGAFTSQDSVQLTSASSNIQIDAGSLVSWNNNTGGVFQFTITGNQIGPFNLHATESQYAGTADSYNNAVVGVTSLTVGDNTYVGVGE